VKNHQTQNTPLFGPSLHHKLYFNAVMMAIIQIVKRQPSQLHSIIKRHGLSNLQTIESMKYPKNNAIMHTMISSTQVSTCQQHISESRNMCRCRKSEPNPTT